jgi:hypothetical protein
MPPLSTVQNSAKIWIKTLVTGLFSLSLFGCHPFKRLEYEFCRLKKQWYTAWKRAHESVGADGKKWHSHFNKMQDAMTQALEISLDKPGFLLPMDQPGFPWVTVMIFMITYTLLCV